MYPPSNDFCDQYDQWFILRNQGDVGDVDVFFLHFYSFNLDPNTSWEGVFGMFWRGSKHLLLFGCHPGFCLTTLPIGAPSSCSCTTTTSCTWRKKEAGSVKRWSQSFFPWMFNWSVLEVMGKIRLELDLVHGNLVKLARGLTKRPISPKR